MVSKWEGNILIVVGAQEDKSLISHAQQAITTHTITATFKVIKEANHFYLNETNLLASEILEWLDEAFLSRAYPDHNSK